MRKLSYAAGLVCFFVMCLLGNFGQAGESRENLTIIIPGYQDDQSLPAWPTDMANAINVTLETPSSRTEIDRCAVNLSGVIIPTASDQFIIYDWSAYSALSAHSAQEEGVVNPLLQAIKIKINKNYVKASKPVDVHFIGHSRGCYTIARVIELMARDKALNNKIGFLSVTTLDPHGLPNDGSISANPGGIVDWLNNFYEIRDLISGVQITGVLNVNLTSIVTAWDGRPKLKVGSNHSEVHDWYHWSIDQSDLGGPMLSPYKDPVLQKQYDQLVQEAERVATTRKLLYGTNPIVENFSEGVGYPLSLEFYQAKGSARPNEQTLVGRLPGGMNELTKAGLKMTPSEPSVAASAIVKTIIEGDFTAEFSLQMKKYSGASKQGDGITFAILDLDKQSARIGILGGHMAYAGTNSSNGMNGFAVAFDNYPNFEHGDPANTDSLVTMRVNGSPRSQFFSKVILPESLSLGNKFRVRITLNSSKRTLALRIYSHGADKVVTMEEKLPINAVIPKRKFFAFTASTGTYHQEHWIDDLIIVPQ